MSHPRTRPGGHLLMATGEKITSADLERIGTMAEQGAYHLLARLCQGGDGNPISGFFGDDCKVAVSSGLILSVSAGTGFYYDTSASDEFGPVYLPIVVDGAVTTTLDAHSGSARIDSLFLAPLLTEDQSESRSVKSGSGVVSAQSVNKRARWIYSLQVVKGTPASNPSAPATPSGYLRIANVSVPATTGAVTVGDTRPLLAFGGDLRTEPSSNYAANFVPAGGLAPSAGTGLKVVVTRGDAVIQGVRHRYQREVLTIATADPSQTRYDAVVADGDGTLQVLTGTPGFGVEPTADADQVKLAVVTILAAGTTVTVQDLRDSSWLKTESIRDGAVVERTIGDGEVTGKKLSVVPVMADVSVNTGTGAVTIQVKDLDGNDFAGEVDLCLEILEQDGLNPVLATHFSTVTTGTSITGIGNKMMILRTNSSGHALTTVILGTSGDNELIRATPMKRPGQVEYTLYTIP